MPTGVTKPIKMYYNCGKMYAKKNLKWINTGTYYPDATTVIKQALEGYASGDTAYYYTVRWYVKFKNYHT